MGDGNLMGYRERDLRCSCSMFAVCREGGKGLVYILEKKKLVILSYLLVYLEKVVSRCYDGLIYGRDRKMDAGDCGAV